MSVRLFVGNLPYDVTESDLREFFSPVGPLTTVIIPTDRDTGKPRGFAFVEFGDPAQAAEATRRFNNQPLKGRDITINEARARESRSDSGPRTGYAPRPAHAGPRPGFSPRPSSNGTDMNSDPMEKERSGRAERRNRNFGADAKPARKRKQYGSKGEPGARRGPIRERAGGQFFGSLDDDEYEDDLDSKYGRDFKY